MKKNYEFNTWYYQSESNTPNTYIFVTSIQVEDAFVGWSILDGEIELSRWSDPHKAYQGTGTKQKDPVLSNFLKHRILQDLFNI
jgi:hypothetical protein